MYDLGPLMFCTVPGFHGLFFSCGCVFTWTGWPTVNSGNFFHFTIFGIYLSSLHGRNDLVLLDMSFCFGELLVPGVTIFLCASKIL